MPTIFAMSKCRNICIEQMPTIFALSKCRQGGNNREEISDANDPAQLKKKIELQTELT